MSYLRYPAQTPHKYFTHCNPLPNTLSATHEVTVDMSIIVKLTSLRARTCHVTKEMIDRSYKKMLGDWFLSRKSIYFLKLSWKSLMTCTFMTRFKQIKVCRYFLPFIAQRSKLLSPRKVILNEQRWANSGLSPCQHCVMTSPGRKWTFARRKRTWEFAIIMP